MKPWEQYAGTPQAQEDNTSTVKDGPWLKYSAASTPGPAPATDGQQKQAKSSFVGGVVNALQGPTMGFYDEAVGATGAALEGLANLTPWGTGRSMAEAYRHHRDETRAMAKAYETEHPVRGQLERAAASLPVAMVAPELQAVKSGGSVLAQAVKTGAGYGAVTGAGESQANTPSALTSDMATGAAAGAVAGPAVAAGLSGGGALARNLSARISKAAEGTPFAGAVESMGLTHQPEQAIQTKAAQKIAQAIERDAGGIGPQTDPMNVVAARQRKLGPEATIADAGGQNTRQLLDTLATLPGKTRDTTERLIHERQAGRAERLIDAAESGLGTQGARLPQTLEALDVARKEAAGPLYDRVRQTTLAVDPVLDSILERASNAFGIAKRLAEVNGQKFTLGEANPGLDVFLGQKQRVAPLSQLDTLKRTLYDIEQSHINPETGRLSELGNAYKDLRWELVAKIDQMTTDPRTGESFYKQARDAYAGPTELRAAANLGNQAMSKDAWKIAQMTEGMSPSELEAFRIGAFESLRKKLGTEGGQSQILKMWKEPATAEKLRELFGNSDGEYLKFALAAARERRLKGLESVGRGSQTAARAAGLDDLDSAAIQEAGNLARAAATGNVSGLLNSATKAWNRATTPEPVRDEMGRMLSAKGDEGFRTMTEIRKALKNDRKEKARRAAQAGAFGGVLDLQGEGK